MQEQENKKKPRCKGRRQRTSKYGGVVRVRVTPEMETAMRRARRMFGVTASELIRDGLMIGLTTCVPDAVAVAEDTSRRSPRRLDAVKWLRLQAQIAMKEM